MNAPDLTEKVIGYRVFYLLRGGLGSMSADYVWTAGVNTAECHAPNLEGAPEHTASPPVPECYCGLYAIHAPPGPILPGVVLGAVAAWGRIEVHCDGFRAQFAEIIALSGAGAEIAALYGVPDVAADELESVAAAHGRPVPAALRPTSEEYEAWKATVLGATWLPPLPPPRQRGRWRVTMPLATGAWCVGFGGYDLIGALSGDTTDAVFAPIMFALAALNVWTFNRARRLR